MSVPAAQGTRANARSPTPCTRTPAICEGQGLTKNYMGETARSSYRRSLEHLQDLRAGREETNMNQHLLEHHPEHVGQLATAKDIAEVFTFKVIKKHMSSLSRQVHEAVRITRSGDTVINSKEEYTRCSIPTLSVSKPQATKLDPAPTLEEQAHLTAEMCNKKRSE